MSQPYVGETRIFPYSFAPAGWMPCDGRMLAISDADLLFNVIGTTYGGDGENEFALPSVTGPESEGTPLTVCISLFGATPTPE